MTFCELSWCVFELVGIAAISLHSIKVSDGLVAFILGVVGFRYKIMLLESKIFYPIAGTNKVNDVDTFIVCIILIYSTFRILFIFG